MSFDKRLRKMRNDIVRTVFFEFRQNKSLFDLMDDEDWDEVYSGLNITLFMSVKDGKSMIEISYSDDPDDRRIFSLSGEIKNAFYELEPDQIEVLAAELESLSRRLLSDDFSDSDS